MHGQLKVKASLREEERKKKEKDEKVKNYKLLMTKFYEKKKKSELDSEVFSVISEILSSNPDIYSLWNYRRQILLHSIETEENDVLAKLLKDELKFTETCLRLNPKSYCCWHHREWCLNNFPQPDLAKELELCTLYLKLDQRNFHCWDYRRMIAGKLNIPAEKELDYTLVKINENFSNYSSWHYRSKLLPKVDPSCLGVSSQEQMRLNDLELVVSAAFTDPSDQSAWFYQRWLLAGDRAEPSLVASLHLNHTLYLSFSHPISPSSITLSPAYSLSPLSPHLIMVEAVKGGEVSVKVGPTDYLLQVGDKAVLGPRGVSPLPPPSSSLASVLLDQLSTCEQLLALEPDSKWTLLTSAHMMWVLDREKYCQQVYDRLDTLIQVDPYRAAYYTDLRSRWKVELALETVSVEEVSLKGLQLTSLPLSQHLLLTRRIDLADNCLISRSIHALLPLQSCRELVLDNNKFESLSEMPSLSNLEVLSLKGNLLSSWSDVTAGVRNLPHLTTLYLASNLLPPQPPSFGSVTVHL